MIAYRAAKMTVLAGAVGLMAGCGGNGLFGGNAGEQPTSARAEAQEMAMARGSGNRAPRSTIWSLFSNASDPNTTVEVNKYLWQASLDVLNFLPVESVDPFTGVMVTGYGTPPGGGRAYRATVYVQDPALDARSLRVALQARGGGAVSAETARTVEDAILTRARQLRVQDSNL